MANSFVRYTGNNSTTSYSIPFSYRATSDLTVTLSGVVTTAYTLNSAGTTLTFTTAPPTGAAVEVMTFTQTDINVPVDGTITSAKLSGDLTLPGDLSFADNNKAIFGAGSDLQIFHDASHSFILRS